MKESLEKLRVSRIDLMLVDNLVYVAMQLATLREWKEQGGFAYLGATHCTPVATMHWPAS